MSSKLTFSLVVRKFFAYGLSVLAMASGAQAAFVIQGNGTVLDTDTGLIWMQCAMGQTWDAPSGACNGVPTTYDWDQASALTGAVTFAGHSDWRLPHARELTSLLDRSRANPASSFPGIASPVTQYWSSTVVTLWGTPRVVDFIDGSILSPDKMQPLGVRLSRGGDPFGALLNPLRPDSDYVDHGDGTITHIPTGLMWQRCFAGNPGCYNPLTMQTFDLAGAMAAAAADSLGGYTDWRLPTIEELESLLVYPANSPSVNSLFPGGFLAVPSLWSTTTSAAGGGNWVVDFNRGDSVYRSPLDTTGISARFVRTNPVFSPTITVAKLGTGIGTVSSNPAGISCGVACSAAFSRLGSVTLTAAPAVGSSFAGWGGDCTGSGVCVLDMLSSRNVSASFALKPVVPVCTLSVSGASITQGGYATLWVNCNPFASSYIWTGGTCAGTTWASCTVTPNATTTYSVAGVNANGKGTAVSATVTVQQVPKPVCTVSAPTAPVVAGSWINLIASCSPAATSYVWTGGTCASSTWGSCSTAPSATTAYTVAGINAGGKGAVASTTVTVAAGVKPVCTVSAPTSPVAAGSWINLIASCSPAATSYVWTGGTCASSFWGSCSTALKATTTYTVAGVNAAGKGAAASALVTVKVVP